MNYDEGSPAILGKFKIRGFPSPSHNGGGLKSLSSWVSLIANSSWGQVDINVCAKLV